MKNELLSGSRTSERPGALALRFDQDQGARPDQRYFCRMSSDAPTGPLCPDCREPMKLVKTLPHLGGLPEILVFYCSRCKQAETKVQGQTA